MNLNIFYSILPMVFFSQITHAQSIEIQIQLERPDYDYEVQDIEQTICWENDPRPECAKKRGNERIDDQQQTTSEPQSDQCISAHQSAVSKCKVSLNPESQNIVRAYANTLNQAQITGNINQACEAAKQINLLSGGANSTFVGLCRTAAASCSSRCRKDSLKKTECDEFIIQSNQSNQQAILNAQLALRSQACVELTKTNLKEVNKENFNVKNIENSMQLAGTAGNSLDSNQVTRPRPDISKLRFTEKGYDFEGNADMKPSKSIIDIQKNTSGNFNADNFKDIPNGRQITNLNEEKINDDYIREDKNMIVDNGYVNSNSYVIGSARMPLDSNIDNKNHNNNDPRKFIPRQNGRMPASYGNKSIIDKNKTNQDSFFDQINRGLDQEIEITSEGNSVGKNSALVTITLRGVLLMLSFALAIYFIFKSLA